jgi:AraC-like DNA-binding protein
LSFGGYSPFNVKAGAMVVAPRHAVHQLTGTAPDLPEQLRRCQPLTADLVELGQRADESIDGIALACGSVDATYRGLDSVFEYLPEPIMIQAREGDVIWIGFNHILRELTEPRAGSKAMLRILLQECFIELLRAHLESGECHLPWLLALEKPRLSQAIETVIESPGDSHSLESLATTCAMSRSTFAAQFSDAFGRSVMDFVKEVRMRAAARMLIHTEIPIKTIASRVGYDSRSHFSHAFHDFFSLSPAEYRLQHGA